MGILVLLRLTEDAGDVARISTKAIEDIAWKRHLMALSQDVHIVPPAIVIKRRG
jgi:hypothetical protein